MATRSREDLPPLTFQQWVIIAFMSVMALSTYLIYAVIAPFYPGEALAKGVTVSQVGLVFAIYFVGVFATSLLLGNFVSTVGARFMYISGMFLRGMSDVIFGFLIYAPDGVAFLSLSLVTRLFESFGSAAFNAALLAIIAKEFPGRIASLNGWIWACNAAGLMMGPPVGGFLYDLGGFTFPFLVLGGAMLLVTAASVFAMPTLSESMDDTSPSTSPDVTSSDRVGPAEKRWMLSLLRNPSIVVDCLATMLMYGPITFVEISLETLLQPFSLSAGAVGLVFTCEMAAFAVSSVIVGQINNRPRFYHPRSQQVGACLLYAIAFLCLAPSPWLAFEAQVWTICLCLVGIGVAASSLNSASVKDIFQQALRDGYPDNFHTHGLASGLYLSAMTLGAFACTYGGSYVSEVHDFPTSTTMYTVIMLAVGALVAVYTACETRVQERRLCRVSGNGMANGEDVHIESTPLLKNTHKETYFTISV